MYKWTYNYDTKNYECMNAKGYSVDRNVSTFNFDEVPFQGSFLEELAKAIEDEDNWPEY